MLFWIQDLIACSSSILAENRWTHCWLRPVWSKVISCKLPLSFHLFCGKSPQNRMHSRISKKPREYNSSKRELLVESDIDTLVLFSIDKKRDISLTILNFSSYCLSSLIGLSLWPEDSWILTAGVTGCRRWLLGRDFSWALIPNLTLEGTWYQTLKIRMNWSDESALSSSMNVIYALVWHWYTIRVITKGGTYIINPSFLSSVLPLSSDRSLYESLSAVMLHALSKDAMRPGMV